MSSHSPLNHWHFWTHGTISRWIAWTVEVCKAAGIKKKEFNLCFKRIRIYNENQVGLLAPWICSRIFASTMIWFPAKKIKAIQVQKIVLQAHAWYACMFFFFLTHTASFIILCGLCCRIADAVLQPFGPSSECFESCDGGILLFE